MSVPQDRAGAGTPIRVVVVEDSLVQRAHLVGVLESDGDIVVIGEAADAIEAIAMVGQLRPHVVTLDLQIPGGGGQYALEQIMAYTPTPIVVLSGTVQNERSAPAIDALVSGALLAMPKPVTWTAAVEHEIRRNVRMLRNVPVIRHMKGRMRLPASPAPADDAARGPVPGRVVAIAASTGGPPALATVLSGLAGLDAPVLLVQHLHEDFVAGLIDWMARVSPLPVTLAVHGQIARRGCVHIAPGGVHLHLGAGMRLELTAHPITVHRPSATELFNSVARHAGEHGIGVLLTGMGDDGATGLAEMRRRGARTIAQDEASSAVYGMPCAAAKIGAVEQVLPLDAIAGAILRASRLPVRR